MKDQDAVSRVTQALVAAHRGGPPVPPHALEVADEDQAYRIQDAVFAALWPGVRATAWKAGGPGDTVEPSASPISTLLSSPARVAAKNLRMPGVEAEIAFRLARDLPPRAADYSDEEVAAAVGEALVTIEVCDTRLADWNAAPALLKLADFQSNSGLVTGSGRRDWKDIDFLAQEVEFVIGARVSRAKGTHSFGNPFRLMPWLARHCARRCGGLRAGDVVTTGAWTGLEIALPGDTVVARFPGIGEASVVLSA